MSKLLFTERAWEEYSEWQTKDKRLLKKINELLKDIERNKFKGIGKPELLKNNLRGYWSRRINEEHRLVYNVKDDDTIEIYQCMGHYDD